jgi:hypothetical protein
MVTIYALDMNISCSNFEGACQGATDRGFRGLT